MRSPALQLRATMADSNGRVFAAVDDALEWIEDRLIEQARIEPAHEAPLQLREMELFAGRKSETLAELELAMVERSCKAGERIFTRGEGGDEIFLVRRGVVRISLPLADGRAHHLASFGRGGFFGEMAFLDQQPRSANAVAHTDCELYVLSRQRFDALVERHKLLGMNLMQGLARLLAGRLRQVNTELNALENG